MFKGARAVAALLGGLLLASCTGATGPEQAKPPPPHRTGPLPGLEAFYAQKLAWGPCAPYAMTSDQRTEYRVAGLDCARMTVPLDYSAPAGRTAQIGVLRHHSQVQPGLGSLVVNPGGPGASGMELAATLSSDLDVGGFDLVGFDPRGVGASIPAIDCDTDQARDADRADDDYDPSPAGVARDEDRARQRAARCAQHAGGADVLADMGTRDVARDMDVLRAVLGEQKLTYLGYSYGTAIGTSYAEQFPTTVRAMVLDGAIDPAKSPVDSEVEQMAGFQQAFQDWANACAKAPNCPVGTDPTRATAQFQALTRPLMQAPAKVRGDTRRLSYGDAITAVEQSMYDAELWQPLTKGLIALRAGDGTGLMGLADDYYGRVGGHYPNDDEALMVINCVDGERITDHPQALDVARREIEAAPFTDNGHGPSQALETCAFLPISPTDEPHLPQVDGLPKVLVISTTGDPATPYKDGVSLARELHASLLTVFGEGHTATGGGDACVDSVVKNYLIHPDQPVPTERCPLPPPPELPAAAPAAPVSRPS